LLILSFGQLVSWSFCRLVSWSFGQLVVWSVGHFVVWSFGRLVIWSFGRLVVWLVEESRFRLRWIVEHRDGYLVNLLNYFGKKTKKLKMEPKVFQFVS
jgi:hypothetical protein